jgi:type I restriction enzyme S subunit
MSRDIPVGWRAGTVKDFFELQRGFDLTEKQATPGPYPVISSSGVSYLHGTAAIDGPAVITGRKGKLGMVHYHAGACWPHDTTLWVKDFKGNLPRFIYWYLLGMRLERFDAATAVPTLNRNNVHAIETVFPPTSEQTRIAQILDSVDEAIQATEAANSQIEVVRARALEELFPTNLKSGLSLSGKFADWRVVPSHEATIAIVDCKNRTPPRTESGYAVVRTPNVRGGRFTEKGLHFTDAVSFAEWTRKGKPQPGDILFTREAPFGEVCAAPQSLEFCLGQRMMFFRPNSGILSSEYLLYALQSVGVQKNLLLKAGGSTVGHLRVSDVRNIPIPVAPRKRQEEITRFLASLDEMADRGARNLEQLLRLKAALMSDLLTGRMRVSTDLPMAAE